MDLAASAIIEPLRDAGFACVRAPLMKTLLAGGGGMDDADWNAFAGSWNDLGVDTYMADGGRYRRRRFSTFRLTTSDHAIVRKAHQPHYQSRDYNALNGGVARWFSPISDSIAAHPALTAILSASADWFGELTPPATLPHAWHVEVHQFRIETGAEAGQPTPEGMHRDGVDWALVMLIRRENVTSGETRIQDASGPLGSFTLTEPMDTALVDDERVFHGVTPLKRIDPARAAYRDVLVVTFRRE